MEKRKIGTLLLTGLMIGPILGSGIIIIPPIAYAMVGSWAPVAWAVIIVTGFLFAWIFGRLTILYPGDAGVAAAIEAAYGDRVKNLASFFLIGAVFFGPVAVMLTAAQYLAPDDISTQHRLAFPLLIAGAFLLLQKIAFIGRLGLVLSSLAAVSLVIGSLASIYSYPLPQVAIEPFSPVNFGHALLLLFWTIVGWEVVGNYSGDVDNPRRTIMRAVAISAVAIAAISLLVALAVQTVGEALGAGRVSVADVMAAVCGRHAGTMMAILVFSLCMTTYLLFVGGVARLILSLAEHGSLPRFLAGRSAQGAPISAVLSLSSIHLGLLLAVYLGAFDVRGLVVMADGFFIGNSLIGILTGLRLLHGRIIRLAAVVLAGVFLAILLFSSPYVLGAMAVMSVAVLGCRLPGKDGLLINGVEDHPQ